MYDIVFISYQEPKAEINWKALDDRFQGRTKRLHGVTGLHRAHKIAANMVNTDMFYVVDGDAIISPNFHFNHSISLHQKDHVHVFRAKNPVNDLVYGYGAVKLLPTNSVLSLNESKLKTDMTSSLPNTRYHVVQELSNITEFNTDPFNAWRSAFRECAKLSSKIIDGQKDQETDHRLDVWCNKGATRPNGTWTIKGAIAGKEYGTTYKNDLDKLFKINDMNWMKDLFEDLK